MNLIGMTALLLIIIILIIPVGILVWTDAIKEFKTWKKR